MEENKYTSRNAIIFYIFSLFIICVAFSYSEIGKYLIRGHSDDGGVVDLFYPKSPPQLYKNQQPWFMSGEAKFFHQNQSSSNESYSNNLVKLWPEENPSSDRILEQLMYVLDSVASDASNPSLLDSKTFPQFVSPQNSTKQLVEKASPGESNSSYFDGSAYSTRNVVTEMKAAAADNSKDFTGRRNKIKTILLYNYPDKEWDLNVKKSVDREMFSKCPVNSCQLTVNRAYLSIADMVIFTGYFQKPGSQRKLDQLWVMHALESPFHTFNDVHVTNIFNMTATYRHDSDVVTPYSKWINYGDMLRNRTRINFSEGKTRQVAWFVSNCYAENDRLEYALELSEYINVDIYGDCGNYTCPRSNATCFDLLSKHYKFYLAFENSNCRDYVTEKFFNSLRNNILPIVMGAHPDDYMRIAPKNSYIHVDDFESPKDLAAYLHKLDSNDDLYNEYFQWKGTGEFADTNFFCRLCTMSHYAEISSHRSRYYKNFYDWWSGPNVCTPDSWRNVSDIFAKEHQNSHQENA